MTIHKEQDFNGTMCIPSNDLPQVVVIGAGFAGINFIKKLRNKPIQIILLDKNNFHQFQPLLYQVAIAGLEPDSIVSPIRKLFQGYNNVTFRMAEVTRIEPQYKKVITNIGWVSYDYLVIASGSATNFYGLDRIEQNSIGLKNIRDALDIRSWVLQNLEAAAITCNMDEKESLTKFVIVGGGPAGVELAGALAEFKTYLLQKDYPELTQQLMKIYLVGFADRLLAKFSEKASHHALEVLQELDVQVLLKTAVRDFDGLNVLLSNGAIIKSKALIWTAGVKGAPPSGLSKSVTVKGNRVKVDAYNHVEQYNGIFAIGDLAAMISDELPKGHPMLAQVAIQQGCTLATNLLHEIKYGVFKEPFQYKDKGTMATIGKNNAVADFGKFNLKGRLAWLLWSTLHLFFITGLSNKLIVGFNWIIHYLTYEKANRLIIRKFFPKKTIKDVPPERILAKK